MTKDEVLGRLTAIREIRGDDESAHGMEDDLYLDLLKSIAGGSCDDPSGCAALAIQSKDIDFCRWCA